MADTPAGQAPGEAMGVFAREQAELAAGGIPDGVIASGALLPDADLFDPLGAPAMLQDAIRDQRAVVVLYRGAWCPCCTIITDTDHVARWVDIHPDYTTRAEPGQILAALGGAGR
jgi:hypothetical protein